MATYKRCKECGNDLLDQEEIEQGLCLGCQGEWDYARKERNMPKKFWIVWSFGYQGYIQRWPSYEQAAQCAGKIAQRLPNTKVYVLEAMDYRWIPEPPVEIVPLEKATS
jgi:hypothetical protein